MPIFTAAEGTQNHELAGLEFGKELEYFQSKAAQAEGPTVDGKSTYSQSVEVHDFRLILRTAGKPERPISIVKQHRSSQETYTYISFEELPFDARLFVLPEKVKVKNEK